MIHEMFSIYDKKSCYYNLPVYETNISTMKRSVLMAQKREDSYIHTFPEDYDVYNVGTYDDLTGEVDSIKPKFVSSIGAIMQEELKHQQNIQAAINGREKIL